MNQYLFIVGQLLKKKSLLRSVLNHRAKQEFLKGDTLDLGSGKGKGYDKLIPRAPGSNYIFSDNKLRNQKIDYETDCLPFQDNQFEDIIFFNVLEHLYNPRNILKEIRRIKKGRLIGSAPFLAWYHKDPHDYVRYTDEALEKIFKECGYEDVKIEIQAIGPYCTAFSQVLPTLPTILRPLLFTPCYLLDLLFQVWRGDNYKRYVLGYYFVCR